LREENERLKTRQRLVRPSLTQEQQKKNRIRILNNHEKSVLNNIRLRQISKPIPKPRTIISNNNLSNNLRQNTQDLPTIPSPLPRQNTPNYNLSNSTIDKLEENIRIFKEQSLRILIDQEETLNHNLTMEENILDINQRRELENSRHECEIQELNLEESFLIYLRNEANPKSPELCINMTNDLTKLKNDNIQKIYDLKNTHIKCKEYFRQEQLERNTTLLLNLKQSHEQHLLNAISNFLQLHTHHLYKPVFVRLLI